METQEVPVTGWPDPLALQYAKPISEVQDTANRVKVFLAFGVLGGTLLALLAGLAVARRAMEPITELTAAARRIEQSRDPSEKMPHAEAEDEVAELGRTLEAMLASLDQARSETESALARQREFVADASHELRTPLTSVLANLELLEVELAGEQRETAASALRSSRRMRRLVADLLLLARADAAARRPTRRSTCPRSSPTRPPARARGGRPRDLGLGPGGRPRRRRPGRAAQARAESDGERAPAHRSRDRRRGHGGAPQRRGVLAVEDDGPGIPTEMREKVFERFYRGSGEQSGSSGLGLSIVRAVAESHRGGVRLEEPLDGRGARFVVRIPAS